MNVTPYTAPWIIRKVQRTAITGESLLTEEELLQKQRVTVNPACVHRLRRAFEEKNEPPTKDNLERLMAELLLLHRFGPGWSMARPATVAREARRGVQASVDALKVGEEVVLIGKGARVAAHRSRAKHPERVLICEVVKPRHATNPALDRYVVVRLADDA